MLSYVDLDIHVFYGTQFVWPSQLIYQGDCYTYIDEQV